MRPRRLVLLLIATTVACATASPGNAARLGCPPTVATNLPASSVGATSATLNGMITGGCPNETFFYHFEYGLPGAGSTSPTPVPSAGPVPAGAVSADVSGLTPLTAYEYYLVVDSAEVDASATPERFITSAPTAPPPPPVVKDPNNPNADLAVALAVDRTVAVIGDRLTYTVTVGNNGPREATAVTLTDVLPMQVGFQSVSTSQGACTGGSSTVCALGAMGDGVVVTVTLIGVVHRFR